MLPNSPSDFDSRPFAKHKKLKLTIAIASICVTIDAVEISSSAVVVHTTRAAKEVERVVYQPEGQQFNPLALPVCMLKCPWAKYWYLWLINSNINSDKQRCTY